MVRWLEGALSESTVSDILSSVKKMEDSLKRLKQARKTDTTNPFGTNGDMSSGKKIKFS